MAKRTTSSTSRTPSRRKPPAKHPAEKKAAGVQPDDAPDTAPEGADETTPAASERAGGESQTPPADRNAVETTSAKPDDVRDDAPGAGTVTGDAASEGTAPGAGESPTADAAAPHSASARSARKGGGGILFAGLIAGVLSGAAAGGFSGWYFATKTTDPAAIRAEIGQIAQKNTAENRRIEAALADMRQRLENGEGAIETLTARLAALEKKVEAQPSTAPAVESGPDLTPRVEALGSILKERGKQIDRLTAAVGELRQGLVDLKARTATIEKDLQAVKDTLAQLAEQGAGGARNAAELEALRKSLEAQIAENRALAEKFARLAAEAEARIAEAERRVAEAEAKAVDVKALTEAASRDARRAVALAELRAALESGAPFGAAIATLRETGVEVPEALLRNAASGVPTLAALRQRFPAAARAALEAAIRATTDESLASRVAAFLKSQIGIRSLAPRSGNDPDAILSRAEAALRSGDLAAALAELENLPPEAREAMAPWLDDARRRLEVQRAFAGLQTALAGQK